MIIRTFFLTLLAALFIPAVLTWADEALSNKPTEGSKMEIFEYQFPVGTPVCRTIDELKAVLLNPQAKVNCVHLSTPLNARYTRGEIFVADGKPKQLIIIEILIDKDKNGLAEEVHRLYSVEPITVTDHSRQRG